MKRWTFIQKFLNDSRSIVLTFVIRICIFCRLFESINSFFKQAVIDGFEINDFFIWTVLTIPINVDYILDGGTFIKAFMLL
jgi:hypothetical protein